MEEREPRADGVDGNHETNTDDEPLVRRLRVVLEMHGDLRKGDGGACKGKGHTPFVDMVSRRGSRGRTHLRHGHDRRREGEEAGHGIKGIVLKRHLDGLSG